MPGLLANPAPSDDWEPRLEPWLFAPRAGKRKQCTSARRSIGASPFQDCPRKIGYRNHRGFDLPPDGQVNGYIKFSSANKQGRRASTQGFLPGKVKSLPSLPIDYGRLSAWDVHLASLWASPATVNPVAPCQRATNMIQQSTQRNSQSGADYPDNLALVHKNGRSGQVGGHLGSPQLLPDSFGYAAKMDPKDRLLFEFCRLPVSARSIPSIAKAC